MLNVYRFRVSASSSKLYFRSICSSKLFYNIFYIILNYKEYNNYRIFSLNAIIRLKQPNTIKNIFFINVRMSFHRHLQSIVNIIAYVKFSACKHGKGNLYGISYENHAFENEGKFFRFNVCCFLLYFVITLFCLLLRVYVLFFLMSISSIFTISKSLQHQRRVTV